MRYNYKSCILLTACVSPGGMSDTLLQDPTIRSEQYKQALDFYLKETDLPIVFCENTMYDMSRDYKQYIDSGRLEYLTFDGNNYDKKKGKGYGEALILHYAICQSSIINHSKYIIKITGRLVISNINQLSSSPLLCFDNLFRSNIVSRYIQTYVFIARPGVIRNFAVKYREMITDDPPGNQIEDNFYKALTQDTAFNKVFFVPFLRIPIVVGISGTRGYPYSMEYVREDNLACTYLFQRDKGHKFLAYPYLLFFYVVLFYKRVRKALT